MPIPQTEEEWKKKLTPEQYQVLREKGTEPAFTGKYWNEHGKGMYTCAGCGAELFSSDAKFDSGTGWPSFYDAAVKGNVELRSDDSYGIQRTEVVCAKCGGHLGHLFEDGPKIRPDSKPATGKRYCINSCALELEKQ